MRFALALNEVCFGKRINALMEWGLGKRMRCGMEENRPMSCLGMGEVEM